MAPRCRAWCAKRALFSFYRDGHGECCAVRKIQPLRKKLATLDAWITGQRADQSVTRAELPTAQEDTAFSTAQHPVYKFNPLAGWTGADVWAYIREQDVPYNPPPTIGASAPSAANRARAPSGPTNTNATAAGGGRTRDDKECGLHAQNLSPRSVAAPQPVRIVG